MENETETPRHTQKSVLLRTTQGIPRELPHKSSVGLNVCKVDGTVF